ncbi:hypothetical protein B0H19DRAFT_1275776 [Mycena capillaripes]|nr:hypothetical protein B0H19DRAFT_1275776 [Mycena capillaripes]
MSAPTSKLPPALQSRHWTIAQVLVQAVVCIFILQSRFWDSGGPTPRSCAPALVDPSGAVKLSTQGPHSSATAPLLLSGAPTASFRDNLRTDINYITSWPANGWSNQVIEFMNLLYLARLTERVPIIPRFRPVHMAASTSHIDFSDVFDLPRLRKELKTPILEWRDVKVSVVRIETVEDLGCWDLHHKTWDVESESLYLEPPANLNLDVSYTPVPKWVRDSIQMDHRDHSMLLWPLASMVTFNGRARSLRVLPKPTLSPLHQASLAPDDQLFCSNSLYFDFGINLLQDRQDLSPAWQVFGRHMHWAPTVQEIANNFTRQMLDIEPGERIPPYIAVHVRHGDFGIWCGTVSIRECFAPLSAYMRRVKEVRAEILEDTGVTIDRVIVTGDEQDPSPWNFTGHETNRYPMFIDAVIHGAAYGFVGTDRSTVSILARRRVSSRGGVAEMVKWGTPHADAH